MGIVTLIWQIFRLNIENKKQQHLLNEQVLLQKD